MTQTAPAMRQEAPYPTLLADLVHGLSYRPGWTFTLGHIDRGQGSEGLTLDIVTLGYNSYHPEQGETYGVHHFMPVPPAAYDRRSWQRWLFEQCLLVERHEACEFFVVDGVKPYAPHHGPGNDPYIVFDHGTDEDVRTSFRGDIKIEDIEPGSREALFNRADPGCELCEGRGMVGPAPCPCTEVDPP